MSGDVVHVPFNGDMLIAVQGDDGVFVAVKPICERLGLRWENQLRRIKRDTVLVEGMAIMAIPSPGGPQETTLLRLDLVNGWLFGVSENHVKPELRDAILVYKRQCFAVLHAHFFGTASPPPDAESAGGGVAAGLLPDDLVLRLALVREARLTLGVSAARALWRDLGLPDARPAAAPSLAAADGEAGGGVLTAAQVQEIRRAYAAGDGSMADIAGRFGVSKTTISRVVHRRSHQTVG